MKNENTSRLRAFRGLSKYFHHREEAHYLFVELATFAVITAASAVALLDAVAR